MCKRFGANDKAHFIELSTFLGKGGLWYEVGMILLQLFFG